MFRKVVTLGFYIFLLSISSGCNRQPAQPSFTPGLGEIMTLTQMRHAKLWFAGQGANWPLARYELDELNEGLEDAATFHPTHKDAPLPIPQLITNNSEQPAAERAELRIVIEPADRSRKSQHRDCHATRRWPTPTEESPWS